MTARRIRGDWWADFRYEGKRIRKKSPVNNKRGAEEYERVLRTRLVNGEGLDGRDSTPIYRSFAGEWLDTYVLANNKPSEVAGKRSILNRHLLPFFGNKTLLQIGMREIERFKARKLASGLSPKRVNNLLTVLRCSLSVASEWGLIEVVPRVKWLRVPPQEFDFFTAEEAARLLAAAPASDYAMLLTALRTGMRRGELRGLRWDDVDLVAKRIRVKRSILDDGHETTPKNHRVRDIPISSELLAALKRHRHLKGDLVFCNGDGSVLTRFQMRSVVPRACRLAGLRRVQWHVLRHSFASQLVMAGKPLKAVQELMGHSTIQMTMRYAHLAESTLIDAVESLDSTTQSPAGFGHHLGTSEMRGL